MFDIIINEEKCEENTALVHSEGLCGHGLGTSLTKRLNPGPIQLL